MALLDPSSDNKLTFKEKVSGSYVNLATVYENVVAYLYDGSTVVDKWSRETQTGYKYMYATDNYTLEFYITRGILTNYKTRSLKFEIKVIKSVEGRALTDNKEHTLGVITLDVGKTETGTLS